MPIRIFRALILVLLSLDICAQYRLDSWTTDNGLPQNSVTGLTQTPDQYLWFTTNDGLVRFDGLRFKVFNKSNTPQITSNRLSGAFADKSGRLWFHAEDGGILYYENGAFTLAAKPRDVRSGTRSRFFNDGAGGVVFNIDKQPYRFRDGAFAPLLIDKLPADTPVMYCDRQGGLWFTGDDILYLFRDSSLQTFSIAGVFNDRTYFVAHEDRHGGFWVGFFGVGDQNSLIRVKDGKVTQVSLPQDAANQIAEDAQGNLWISVFSQGIFRIDHTLVAAPDIPADAVKPVIEMDGISTNSSGHLLFDREGGLWIGTEKGLNRLSPQIIKVFSKKDGLIDDNVYPLHVDRKGTLWAGVWPNNLVRYEGGKFTTRISHETVFVASLFEDSSDRLWFGTLGKLFYLRDEQLVSFTEQTGFAASTEFSVIQQTPDNALWFGTSRGLGKYANDLATIYTTRDGLPDDYVVALLPARDGKLWIGTRGGLASFENGAFRSFTQADGLASNYVRSLYEDADGVLWIGSYDGGLTRLKDGRFTAYTMTEGLSSNGVFCILEDDAGWFWINSNQGIYRVSRRELNDFADGRITSLNSIAYNRKDGLLNVEGNGGRQPAGTKSSDGRLWFPTAEGMAVIDPATVTLNQTRPPVMIEEVMIDRHAVSNEAFQSAVTHRSKIELAPGQNNIEINYTALSFINSDQLRFKYKLENLDAEWNEIGTRRTAYYSYLQPGEYVFKVIAANRDGVWNEEGASLAIIVHPPFYRTWWFTLLLILVGVALIALIYYLRVRQLKTKSAQQEDFARELIASQERERGRIASEMHDGLGQSLAIIKNRAMISLSRPDDSEHAIEQLKEIADASTEAIDEVHDIIYDLRPIQLDRLGLSGAIEDMAERIAEINRLQLSKDVDDVENIFSKQTENSIYRIVQESLNNVVTHSDATAIELSVKKTRNGVRIVVQDDGRGFDSARSGDTDGKGGFGLIGMSERAKLLGGRAVTESIIGVGTKVTLTLPYVGNERGPGKAE